MEAIPSLKSQKLKAYKAKEKPVKVRKFKKHLITMPWLLDVIDPLGHMRHDPETMSVVGGITPNLRRFIKDNLEYMAFRPRTQLPDLLRDTLGSFENTMTLEYAIVTDSHYGGNKDNEYWTEWSIVSRVGDGIPYVSDHDDGYTLNESIMRLAMDYAQGNWGEGDLIITHIVKVTHVDIKKSVDNVYQSVGHKVHVEIFERVGIIYNLEGARECLKGIQSGK